MTTTPIKYLLIGDAETGKQITEYSNTGCSSQAKKIGLQIFQKVVKSPTKKLDERNKIVSKGEIYYFIFTQTNLIFLVLVDESYPERLVFQLIETIKNEKITLMVNDETKELNPQGRQAIKQLVEQYQDQKNFNKIAEIQKDDLMKAKAMGLDTYELSDEDYEDYFDSIAKDQKIDNQENGDED